MAVQAVQPAPKVPRRISGFTLIEILVVISIIALLVAILLPSLARARQLTKNTICQTNLHSIGQGLMLYVHDYKGLFPAYTAATRVDLGSSTFQNNQFYLYGDSVFGGSGHDVPGFVRPVNKYIHKKSGVYECPFDTENPVVVSMVLGYHYKSSYAVSGNSYPYNVGLDDLYYTGPDVGLGTTRLPVLYLKKIDAARNASRLVMAGDTTSVYPQEFTLKHTQPWYATFFTHDPKKPLCNLLFVDGHVTMTTMRDPHHHIVNSVYSLVLPGTPVGWYDVPMGP